ncbi:MAG: DUF4238 domain-containing protein [Deltaproteobacteria bacterium]|jgi:hypothetical protein|nr:DUF4238 domain-containing protein [Deltaproteobacteria bacterium]MDL1986346.1 DUF4238 domain-containing protein [Deltaproteobacteria bacterium]
MSSNKKRKHHYVWRKYLRAWAIDEKIYCLREKKIINPNLMGVAQQRDFYKLNELSDDDIVFIRNFIEQSPTESRRGHEQLLSAFTHAHRVLKKYPKISASKKAKEAVDLCIHNLDEDFHSGIEAIGGKYLNCLLNKDTAFFKTDKGFLDFIYYLCVQYMRTKKIKESTIKAFKPTSDHNAMSKSNNILNHILATNMSGSLYVDRNNYKLMMIENNSKKDFITGDQPVINIFSLSTPKNVPPENLAFYYPISPKLAILVIEKNRFEGMGALTVTEQEVDSYNKAIMQCSFEQVYSLKKSTLETLMN